jgi:UDP-2,3-diacylglucosamine pyrophosphatase LpxH
MATVVISDIHIGTNEVTNWYQSSIHEPYFVKMVHWIVNHKDDLGLTRFLILGDLFDFWTYPPDMQPPNTQAILAKNPGLFGPGGAFSMIFAAFGNEVYYIRGNHDINVTQADLDLITDGTHKVTLLPDEYPDPSLATLFTHGHLYTMFNAPGYPATAKIPAGHFITRAVAYYVKNHVKPGQTAADLEDQGVPSLWKAELKHYQGGSFDHIGSNALEVIATATGLSKDAPIILPDGSTMTLREAIALYGPLYQLWSDAYGGGTFGGQVAEKAALADRDGTYIAWFATRKALQSNMIAAVMGHTHIPKLQIDKGAIKYMNTGFECTELPTLKDGEKQFNFGVVSKAPADNHPTMSLYKIVKQGDGYDVKNGDAEEDKIVFYGTADYSCYVRIDNNSDQPMILTAQPTPDGYYIVPPPQTIAAHSSAWIWVQDKLGLSGAKGQVSYTLAGKTINLGFTCPTAGINGAGGAPLSAKSGDGNWQDDKVPPSGHPLFVKYHISG